MTNVLFISYYFPPLGGAGVQRSLQFARFLPEHGFEPVIVAGPLQGHNRWEPQDDSLQANLPANTPIYRPETPAPPVGRAARIDRLLARHNAKFRWWRAEVLELGRRAAREHDVALVYVSMSPFSGLEPALSLGSELGLPVVADLRDPWALDEAHPYLTAVHKRRELAYMRTHLPRADRILMNTPEAGRVTRAALAVGDEQLFVLTNGYDEEHYANVTRKAHTKDTFRIFHSGALHLERALQHARRPWWRRKLGGEVQPVELIGRSHWYLLRALEQLVEADPSLSERVELVLAGVLTERDQRAIAESRVAQLVQTPGYLDHASVRREQASADLLFLPLYGLPAGRRARIVPGKTYEYLASGRPILAALPEGDAKDFVLAANAGRVVPPCDTQAIAQALRAFLEEAPQPDRPLGPAVERFGRRRLTAELAGHFRALLAR